MRLRQGLCSSILLLQQLVQFFTIPTTDDPRSLSVLCKPERTMQTFDAVISMGTNRLQELTTILEYLLSHPSLVFDLPWHLRKLCFPSGHQGVSLS